MASVISGSYIFIWIKSGEGRRCSNDCPNGELKGTQQQEQCGAVRGIGVDWSIMLLLGRSCSSTKLGTIVLSLSAPLSPLDQREVL